MDERARAARTGQKLAHLRVLLSWLDAAVTDLETRRKAGFEIADRVLLLADSIQASLAMDRKLAQKFGRDYGVDPRDELKNQLREGLDSPGGPSDQFDLPLDDKTG